MAVKITYQDMPHMKPVPMETKSKGFFGGIWLWIATTRKWEITKDWKYAITHEGNTHPTYYKIPKGFVFDGAIHNQIPPNKPLLFVSIGTGFMCGISWYSIFIAIVSPYFLANCAPK